MSDIKCVLHERHLRDGHRLAAPCESRDEPRTRELAGAADSDDAAPRCLGRVSPPDLYDA